MSEMLTHLIMTYKYGLKQLYYFNTYDGAGEVDVDKMVREEAIIEPAAVTVIEEDENCESCVI